MVIFIHFNSVRAAQNEEEKAISNLNNEARKAARDERDQENRNDI